MHRNIGIIQLGAEAFNGDARWIAIKVRCPAGSGGYTELTPRQRGIVRTICGAHAKRYGYDLSGAATPRPREDATPAAAAPAGP